MSQTSAVSHAAMPVADTHHRSSDATHEQPQGVCHRPFQANRSLIRAALMAARMERGFGNAAQAAATVRREALASGDSAIEGALPVGQDPASNGGAGASEGPSAEGRFEPGQTQELRDALLAQLREGSLRSSIPPEAILAMRRALNGVSGPDFNPPLDKLPDIAREFFRKIQLDRLLQDGPALEPRFYAGGPPYQGTGEYSIPVRGLLGHIQASAPDILVGMDADAMGYVVHRVHHLIADIKSPEVREAVAEALRTGQYELDEATISAIQDAIREGNYENIPTLIVNGVWRSIGSPGEPANPSPPIAEPIAPPVDPWWDPIFTPYEEPNIPSSRDREYVSGSDKAQDRPYV